MLSIRPITVLPSNFGAFSGEVAEGLSALYGPKAGEQYRAKAKRDVQSTLNLPGVTAFSAVNAGTVVGILMTCVKGDTAQIFFLHVLKQHRASSVAHRLIEGCVGSLRAGSVSHVTCESIIFSEGPDGDAFPLLGFNTIPRAIMKASLEAELLQCVGEPMTRVLHEDDFQAASHLLFEAYRRDPGRQLHSELRSVAGCQGVIESTLGGGFGPFQAPFARVAFDGERCVGVILGCEVAPQVGFIVQVAVRPDYRRRGLARQMVQELAGVFRAQRFAEVALGVTLENPARNLYEQLGFSIARPINAYTWVRPGAAR